MFKRIKKLWVNALRSGEYKQCVGTLRRIDYNGASYCCLGVLTQLYIDSPEGKKNRAKWKKENNNYGILVCRRKESGGGYLPMNVMKWAGLANTNPVIAPGSKKNAEAAIQNDNVANFKQIATLIDRNL